MTRNNPTVIHGYDKVEAPCVASETALDVYGTIANVARADFRIGAKIALRNGLIVTAMREVAQPARPLVDAEPER